MPEIDGWHLNSIHSSAKLSNVSFTANQLPRLVRASLTDVQISKFTVEFSLTRQYFYYVLNFILVIFLTVALR